MADETPAVMGHGSNAGAFPGAFSRSVESEKRMQEENRRGRNTSRDGSRFGLGRPTSGGGWVHGWEEVKSER